MRPTLLGHLTGRTDGTWDRPGRPATSGYAVTWREFTSLLIPEPVYNVLGQNDLASLIGEWGDNLPNEVQHFGRWMDTDRLVLSPIIVIGGERRAIGWAKEQRQRYFYNLDSGEVCETPL